MAGTFPYLVSSAAYLLSNFFCSTSAFVGGAAMVGVMVGVVAVVGNESS